LFEELKKKADKGELHHQTVIIQNKIEENYDRIEKNKEHILELIH